jgi:uncharacterized protein YciI
MNEPRFGDLRAGMNESVLETKSKLLQQLMYVAIATPVREVDDEYSRLFAEHLPAHWEWLTEVEERGHLFASGPFVASDGNSYPGDGLLIFRADSLAEATAIAEADPIHQAGLRTLEIRPWEMNEGGFTLSVRYSDSRFELR